MVIVSVLLLIALSFIVIEINKILDKTIEANVNEKGECEHDAETGFCPFETKAKLAFPIYFGWTLIALTFLFGIYLIFFSKKEIEKKPVKIEKKQDKFKIILSALDEDEQKIMNAVKEQDGIKQSTLRIRTDMSKTKLSLVLKDLEKKNLIKKVAKGKTNQVFLKRAF